MEILQAYPVRKCDFEETNGIITVLFYKKPGFFEKIFFKKLAEKPLKIDLDEVGSYIWNLCDGNNKTEDIIKKSETEFGEKIEPADKRVTLFIEQMNEKHFIQLYKKLEETKE